jgi:hypothetical protein
MAKILKTQCPTCQKTSNAEIVTDLKEALSNEDGDWTQSEYRILRCQGCETVFFQQEIVVSDDVPFQTVGNGEPLIPSTITTWPTPSKRQRPTWFKNLIEIDSTLHHLMYQIYSALDADLDILAATGARTAFDRASTLLKIDPSLAFGEKLDELVSAGHIGESDKSILETLIGAGSAAAHRGWKPTSAQLDTVMSILEAFLHNRLILSPKAKVLKRGIPRRQKRQKK